MMKRTIFALILCLFVSNTTGAEQFKALEFSNREFKDILLTFGQMNGISIIPDETVEGRASYFFSEMDTEQALRVFLDNFNLFYTKVNGVYYVSKVKVEYEKETGKLTVRATNAQIRAILQAVSARIGKTIMVDNIPNDLFSIFLQDGKIDDLFKTIIARYSDYYLDKQDMYYYIRRKATDSSAQRPGEAGKLFQRTGDTFSINLKTGRFRELVLDLFNQGKREFLLLTTQDPNIDNLYLSGKTFDEMLKVILMLGNADSIVSQDMTVITDVPRNSLLKKYLVNQIIPLQYISSTDFLKLLPSSLSSNTMKLDEKQNKIVLSGSQEEIAPIINFLKMVDRPTGSNRSYRVDLDFLKADEFLPLLPADFSTFQPQVLPGKTSFLITMPEAKKMDLDRLLINLDRPPNSFPIRLKYIKADDLLAALPPTVSESNFSKTKDLSLVFFKGTETARQSFLMDLTLLDVPKAQLRYEILVMQYTENNNVDFKSQIGAEKSNEKENFSATGNFKDLLSVSMDVIGNFGYAFGLDLSFKLQNALGNVLADTTLSGISGEKISFQNTNTYRYQDYPIDPATGKPSTIGVLRELASGLILNVEGWASGDSMITMKIDATLSKQESTASTSTTENKINTNIRTANGSPLVIGGLKRDEVNFDIVKVPFLGDIPLLGFLFQNRVESRKRSEFVIYIIPHVEVVDKDDQWLAEKLYGDYTRMAKVF